MKKITITAILLFLFISVSAQDNENFNLEEVLNGRTAIGRLLFAIDLYGARATDHLFQKGIIQNDKRLRGWVVVIDDIKTPRVIFYGFQGVTIKGFHQVTFKENSISYQDISKRALTDKELGLINARETVLSKFKPLCDVKYNPAVLEIKERIAVYMIPASTTPDKISFSGPQVFFTDKKGINMVEYKTFFETCLNYERKDKNGKMISEIEISLPVEKIPNEILVLLSVLHNTAFKVTSSDKKMWKVEKGTITAEVPVKK